MNAVLALALLLGFTALNCRAGDHMTSDGITMKDGKMMVMKGGETMAMTKEMTLTNGTTVMTDGTVTMKNGDKVMMKDGQIISMDGKMSASDSMGHDKTSTSKTGTGQ